jgi:hypothetical protein
MDELNADLIVATLCALGLPSIISGIVLFNITKMAKKDEEARQLRIKESVLIMERLEATGQLARESALAIQSTSHPHDKIDTALVRYDATQAGYQQFLVEQTARVNRYS